MILSQSHFSLLRSHHTAEQEDQRRTRSLSQLNLPGGAAGRRNTGSVLLNSGDGMDTEKEIQAASERRRTTARWVVHYNVWNLRGFGSVTTHTDMLPLLLPPSTIMCFRECVVPSACSNIRCASLASAGTAAPRSRSTCAIPSTGWSSFSRWAAARSGRSSCADKPTRAAWYVLCALCVLGDCETVVVDRAWCVAVRFLSALA
jgi:hypothetical protein